MHLGGALPWRPQRWFRTGATGTLACLALLFALVAFAGPVSAQDDDDDGGRGARDNSEETIDDLDCDDLDYNEAIVAECDTDIIAERRQELVEEGVLEPLPERIRETDEAGAESLDSDRDDVAGAAGADDGGADDEDSGSSGSGDGGDDGDDDGSGGTAAGGRIGTVSTGSGAGASTAIGVAAAGLAAAGGLLAAGRRRREGEPLLTPVDGDIASPAQLPDGFAYDLDQERITPDRPIDAEVGDLDAELAAPAAGIVLPAEGDVPAVDVPGIEVPGIEVPVVEIPEIGPDESA